MKVFVRLLLLAGAAAAMALMIRAPLAQRLALRIAPEVKELAEASKRIAPRATMLPFVPSPASSMLPFVPPTTSHTPIVPAPLHKHAAPKASVSAPPTITRKQLEDAIATRLDGAKAALVRDENGHPLGLRLSGVGKLAPFGVHDGDILVSANGYPLRTSEEALSALGKLQDAKRVVVTFRRGAGSYSVPVELVD